MFSVRAAKAEKERERRWEVGGDFHWLGLPAEPCLEWPASAFWYALGRHAVLDLAAHLKVQAIWVPEYFHAEVAEAWRSSLPVKVYLDDPSRSEPDWATLQHGPRDMVIAVNYFGVREGACWTAWRRKHDCILVEDHTHDPFSPWAAKSRAHFAFASLRKTLPVSDGAILWSPRKLPMVPSDSADDWSGSAMRLAAMIWKADYLAGKSAVETKADFRKLQLKGTERLEKSAMSGISPWSAKYLQAGVPTNWRTRRRENARRLLEALEGWRVAKPLFKDWPKDAVPFAAVLVFPSQTSRDDYRAYLSSRGVYCPIHWEASGAAGGEVRELASCVLTIPTDQRYSADDMLRVADILKAK